MPGRTVDLHTADRAPIVERGELVLRDAQSGGEERIPFESITRIGLHQWLPGVYSLEIRRRDRPCVTVRYRHFVALGARAERSADYVDLVSRVLQESAAANRNVHLAAGSTAGLVVGIFALVVSAAAAFFFLGALNVGDLRTGQPVGFSMPDAVLVGAATMPVAFFVGGAIQQGWSRAVDPLAPPRRLLPMALPRSSDSGSS